MTKEDAQAKILRKHVGDAAKTRNYYDQIYYSFIIIIPPIKARPTSYFSLANREAYAYCLFATFPASILSSPQETCDRSVGGFL